MTAIIDQVFSHTHSSINSKHREIQRIGRTAKKIAGEEKTIAGWFIYGEALIDDQPWFFVRDICDALNIKNSTHFISNLGNSNVSQIHLAQGRARSNKFISERGFYVVSGGLAMDFTLGDMTVAEAVWVPLVSALAGGVLALLGSFGATWQNNRAALKIREEEIERQGAESAYATFFKLLEAHSYAANLQRQINEMFDKAAESGGADMEPWAKVMELVGAADEIRMIEPSESSFLIAEKQADLLNDIHLIQRRIANIMASASKYNEVRSEVHEFLVANMSEGELREGTQFAASFEGVAGIHAEMLSSRANNLLGQIMEFLEKDVPAAWDITERFKSAATERFGEKFPKFNLDLEQR